MTVLIVDDQPDVVRGEEQGVDWKKLGIDTILTAYSVPEAEELLLSRQVDVLLCDIEMPPRSGLELLEKIREKKLRTRCIFLSAHAEFTYAQEAVRLGGFDYILQPAPYRDIERAVLRALDDIKEKDVPAVFFNRAVSTDNNEAAELFKGYEKSAFIGTDFTQAGIMQGKMIGEYVLEHFDEIDLNHDGKISYVMFKGDEANQEAIARTKYGVECADEVLTAAGKPALEFYDASNANKYLVDLNGTWSNTASFDYMQTILAQYNEANNNMVEVVICNNDDMALGAINALVNAGYNLPGGEGCTVIPVFGVDATDAAKELIANKQMTGSIKQDAEGMADAVATITANLIAGKDKFEGLNENYEVVDGWTVNIPYSVYTGE